MRKLNRDNGLTAIYVRRSVSDKDKGNNSLSIAAQKEECIRYIGADCKYRLYCDDGKSGKDVAHRPAFQQMMQDARDGLISRIIVKKYDRFSRNMREYLNITDELDKLGVSVYSLSEPFNTETKEGRMMRNNLLNFAEFERETIAARVADAYNTKAHETGFYQGGKIYFGFVPERRTINGKTGSVLVPSEQAIAVIEAYKVYQNPDVSLYGVIQHLESLGIDTSTKCKRALDKPTKMDRSHWSRILQNPLYVRADKSVYEFFVSNGYEIIDDVSAFDGVHGLFWHTGADGKYIKVGYHEGLIDAETWLKVQDKKSHNQRFANNSIAKNSWLVGLTKCAYCGYAFNIIHNTNKAKTKTWRYYNDSGAYRSNSCTRKRLKIKPDEVEQIVYDAMVKRIEEIEIAKKESRSADTETETLRAEILRCDNEIRGLLDKLASADDVLFSYIQQKVSEIHAKKAEYEEKLRNKERRHKEMDTKPLSKPLSKWDSLTMEEKHRVASMMIEVIYISDEDGVDIHFIV